MSTHHPSTTALTEDTGEQQIISTGPTRAELRGRTVAGPVRRGGWALLASAAVAAGYYALTTGSAPRPITGLLLAGVVTLAVLGGGCLIGGWGVRVIVTELHRVGCRLRREISTELGQELERQIAECAEAVRQRIEAVPNRGDRYLAGYADGLAGRTLGETNVVPMNGHRHHGDT